jgi:alkylation response protein AidB-like acyl-CoA dehydrogenase
MTLRYHPDPEQRALAESFDRPIFDLLPLARVHLRRGEARDAWSALAELGLFGIGADESEGGAGLGMTEQALLAERLGRALAAPAVFATMIAVQASIAGELRSRLIAGEAKVAAAFYGARGIVVVDRRDADLLLLCGDENGILARVDEIGKLTSLDDRLWLAEITAVQALPTPVAHLDAPTVLRARLIEAAALAGIAGSAVDMAVAYAGVREQFGRPIGAFQAVKHHCADMAMAARAAIDQLTFAAVALDETRGDAPLQVEAALVMAIEAAIGNARINIQVHGGIGFSDEADPHLLLKRAHLQATIAGGSEAARSRLAEAAGAL